MATTRSTRSTLTTRISLSLLALAVPLGLAAGTAAEATPRATLPGAAVRTAAALATPNADGHLRPAVHNDLLRSTLAEEEDESGSQSLGALCQTFTGGTNPYARLTAEVDLIVRDGVTRAGSGTGCGTAQNETPIAVNPEDPRNLVAGSNDYRLFNSREQRNDGGGFAYTSMDGGRTWRNAVLPGLTVMTGAQGALSLMDSAGDPAIAFGPGNRVYYANLVFSRLSTASGVVVSTSDDGGLTWGPPNVVRLDGVTAQGTATPTPVFNDKEWIAVDPASGTVYVTWTRFTYTDGSQESYLGSPVVVASSTDGGRTFTAPRPIGPRAGQILGGFTPYSSGTVPQVGRDGSLYVAYETAVCRTLACDQPTDHDAAVVATSRDGGHTFRLTEVGISYDFPVNADTGRGTLSGEVFRVNSFPSLTYDASTDQLSVAWADDRNGLYSTTTGRSVQTDGDVFWATSRDGLSWGPIARIGTQQDEVFPWIAGGGGTRAVSYYTRLYSPWDPFGLSGPARFGVGLDYAMTVGGSGHVMRLTSQTSDPRIQFTSVGEVSGNLLSGVFIGDYTGLVVGSDGVAHPIWTDFRGRPGTNRPNQDAMTRAVPLR